MQALGWQTPRLTPPAQTFRGSCLVYTVGTASLPQRSQVLENVWGLINRTAAALTTRVRNHWLVPRLHSTRGQCAELQRQLRHPARPRASLEAFLILNYLWLFLLTQGIPLLNPAKASVNYKEAKLAHIWTHTYTHTHYTHKTRLVSNLSHANIYIYILIFFYLSVPGLVYMWDLVPWPGIEPQPPVLGAWSLSHWTTREVPPCKYILKMN